MNKKDKIESIDTETRRKYWNENYYDYWKKRVNESNYDSSGNNSGINANDKLTSSDLNYIQAIKLLDIKQNSEILELGCGFGRSLPSLQKFNSKIYAVDISEAMIDVAKKLYSKYINVEFQVSEAEKTPFSDNKLDYIICFGVFDAVAQTKVIKEINRILNTGGKALITGKNINYNDDDNQALIAENKARDKGHPNYFTDFSLFRSLFPEFGFREIITKYFRYRGDFHLDKYELTPPDYFYEYILVIEKISTIDKPITKTLSKLYSETWNRANDIK